MYYKIYTNDLITWFGLSCSGFPSIVGLDVSWHYMWKSGDDEEYLSLFNYNN